MKLFVGLGNPGQQYAFNRHNVGFMAVDAIAAAYDFPAWRKRFSGLAAEGRLGGESVLLFKPQTFMNESGRAVGEAARFYKVGLDDVVVFHDELDLPPGKVRLKTGGGVAGHNGLRSLGAHIGYDYVRVRIGIGHPGRKDRVTGHVLHDFAKADQDWLEPVLGVIAENAPYLAEGAGNKFQSRVAHALQAVSASAADEKAAKTDEKPAEGTLAGKLRRWFGA
jgi:peptidyl-tRNA hydrolase, PTH1 family